MRIIRIESCAECPHCKPHRGSFRGCADFSFRCSASDAQDIDNIQDIPGWCPLEIEYDE